MKKTSNTSRKVIRYFYIFLVFSVIGWLYEMSLFFIYKIPDQIYNRGFLLGPYLPIYGFGSIIIVLFLSYISNRYIKTYNIPRFGEFLISFVSIVILTTTLELLSSYALQALNIDQLWDYSNFKYNFQGRISLQHSIRFGFGGMVFVYIILPILDKTLNKLDFERSKKMAYFMAIVMSLDFIIKIFN